MFRPIKPLTLPPIALCAPDLLAFISDGELVDYAVPTTKRSCGHEARSCFLSGCSRTLDWADVFHVLTGTRGIRN